MLQKLGLTVAKGLLALLPISLTLFVIIWLVTTIEESVLPFIPHTLYFPGLGVLITLLALIIVGLLVNAYILQLLIAWGNGLLERIPLVKTVYGTIHDAVNLIKVGKEQEMKSVVSVRVTDAIHLIGFITNDEGAKSIFKDANKIGVYVPLSYQIGGYTLYIDRDQITPLDIDVETAMRISLTGGSSNQKVKPGPEL
ncbi:DUF502 domain-containing protein [Alteromonas oceanisediminis]|uniref:DUF502 domain-containing protein n=1 Tax=Alteromonas oceanisediminis TaxID=2836180 RepID=UPI001BDA07A7|nr:DUF502 domain-containing protein [Alteromonas oceanisediminis]MBT0586992.1 DUF502 domain-containing protein [Alteromonas oceanisediminis]